MPYKHPGAPETDSSPLVGVAEAAEILGVSRSLVGRWYRHGTVQLADGRRVLFPQPIQILRATPVWYQADIERLRDARAKPADLQHV